MDLIRTKQKGYGEDFLPAPQSYWYAPPLSPWFFRHNFYPTAKGQTLIDDIEFHKFPLLYPPLQLLTRLRRMRHRAPHFSKLRGELQNKSMRFRIKIYSMNRLNSIFLWSGARFVSSKNSGLRFFYIPSYLYFLGTNLNNKKDMGQWQKFFTVSP